MKGVSYDLSTDYTDYLTLSHSGERDIVVAWPTWGDFYVRSLEGGWLTNIYWTDQKLTLVLNGTSGTTGTLTVYCGSRGMPKSVRGFSTTPEYNAATKILSGQVYFASEVTVILDFTMPTETGGGPAPAVTFTAGTVHVEAYPGKTLDATLNFTWTGANQITITNIRFEGTAAGWVVLAESLPKTVSKQVGEWTGTGTVTIRLIIPETAPLGEYAVPATLDAEAVGTSLTASGYVQIRIVQPPPTVSTVPDYMTFVFAVLLLALVAYAYLKH